MQSSIPETAQVTRQFPVGNHHQKKTSRWWLPDEMEKAHSAVHRLLLQVMDEGEISLFIVETAGQQIGKALEEMGYCSRTVFGLPVSRQRYDF